MNEKITIIVPAYNIEHFLPGALDSIIAQTYENLEIIIINDGSSDGTADVIAAYAEKDFRIRAVHKENGGVTSARLRGVAEATGDYLSFTDGDDYIEPDMIETLYKNLKKYQADISHCGYQMVFPSRVDYYHNTGKIIVQENAKACVDLLEGSIIEPALVNKLYRRELFDGLAEWMDTSVRINEDLLMNFYLFRKARTSVFEDVCPYHYVLRKGSASTSVLNEHKLRDPHRVLNILLDETVNMPDCHRIITRRIIYQLISSATLSEKTQKELIIPFRQKARKDLRRRLFSTLTENDCGIKLKIMALWTSVWPWSYGFVHRFYARLTGVDKKYEVK